MAKNRKDWEAEWKSVAKEYRKLAKRANQRLVRLERYAEKPQYKNILKYSYAQAQRSITALYGKKGDKLRFTEKPRQYDVFRDNDLLTGPDAVRANVSALKQKIKAMESFLEAPTSTLADLTVGRGKNKVVLKPGIMSTNDRRAATLKERIKKLYGVDIDLSAEDLGRFFNSRKQKKLENTVGSYQMFIVASVMKEKQLASNKRDLQKFFKENIELEDLPEGVSINEKDYKNAGEYFEKLSEFIELTGNELLDRYVTDAIKKGINSKNLFLK